MRQHFPIEGTVVNYSKRSIWESRHCSAWGKPCCREELVKIPPVTYMWVHVLVIWSVITFMRSVLTFYYGRVTLWRDFASPFDSWSLVKKYNSRNAFNQIKQLFCALIHLGVITSALTKVEYLSLEGIYRAWVGEQLVGVHLTCMKHPKNT